MVQIDIEMPIYCYDCPCHNGENGRCNITGDSTFDKRLFDCPLKEEKSEMNNLISRQAAIDAIRASASKYTGFMGMEMYTDDDAVEAINDVPSARPERPKGKWIPGREIAREYGPFHEKCDKYSPNIPCNITYENYKCSCCGLIIDRLLYDWKGEPFYKFCPNCGADMRGERKITND